VALLAGSLLLTFMAAIAAGLVPARMASRIDLARAIKSE
jgi:ABC-type antimicrobial peptide transport system permease subunit